MDELSSINILVPGSPHPWRAPLVTRKGFAYDSKSDIKKKIKAIIKGQFNLDPIKGPVHLSLIFEMPIPKSASKKKKLDMLENKIKPTTRPDLTNLQKLIEDCLIGSVIVDDNQVISVNSKKLYSSHPQTKVFVKTDV